MTFKGTMTGVRDQVRAGWLLGRIRLGGRTSGRVLGRGSWFVGGVVLLVGLTGCQETWRVGVANHCGEEVDVSVSSVRDDIVWESTKVDEVRGVVSTGSDPRSLFLYVRNKDLVEQRVEFSSEEIQFFRSDAESDISSDSRGDLDVLIPIEGEFCP